MSARPPPAPVLAGRFVRLEPLTPTHLPGLVAVGLDPTLWETTRVRVATADEMAAYVATALAARDAGTALPFALLDAADGTVAGTTRLAAIELGPQARSAELGWTLVAPRWQRTPLNTEAKYLLLGYAFAVLGLWRVEFRATHLNTRSRAALRRIGAVEEGVLRHHLLLPDGRIRHTVVHSILADEWPAVRSRLVAFLARPWPPAAAAG